jgi:hypothetical protein
MTFGYASTPIWIDDRRILGFDVPNSRLFVTDVVSHESHWTDDAPQGEVYLLEILNNDTLYFLRFIDSRGSLDD